MINHFYNMFTPQERNDIQNAPLKYGTRHPTWFPLFLKEKKFEAFDFRLINAVGQIIEAKGEKWLDKQKQRLLDLNGVNNASASMAEIRVYGGLLEAGFKVTPIDSKKGIPTPDFRLDSHDDSVEIEVASKHQPEKEADKRELIHKAMNTNGAKFPEDVEYCERRYKDRVCKIAVSELFPSGAPDPKKSGDSVQSNAISGICAIKGDEKQFSGKSPAILVVDLTAFGGREIASMSFSNPSQASPLICGHEGLTSGFLWYAMYGWSGAPIFEQSTTSIVQMQHEGRFRLSNQKKSKLSAVLFLLPTDVVLFENPWSKFRLPDDVRTRLCCYPYSNLAYSICDWRIGDAEKQIALHCHMICTLEQQLDICRPQPC